MQQATELKLSDFAETEPIPAHAATLILDHLRSGKLFRYTGDNSEVTRLEQEFAQYMGMRFAVAVNSCSSALFLSLLSTGVRPGDKVIMPAFTFEAVPSAIVHAGAIPVLVEVNDNYRLDLDDLRTKMSTGIRAVLISHMRGHTSDMDAIMDICSQYDVPLIEDAAHSLGATWRGRKIGSLGSVSCFSFQSYKIINGGEGGILATDDDEIISKAVIMSGAYEKNWQKHHCASGKFERFENHLPLYNMRLSNLPAIVVRSQIPLINERARDGREKAALMRTLLEKSDLITMPKADSRETPAPDSMQFNLVGFSGDEAARFMQLVRQRGVSLYVFGLHVGNARAFWNWKFIGEIPDLPKTRAMLLKACDFRLPLSFSDAKIKAVADIIIASLNDVKNSAH